MLEQNSSLLLICYDCTIFHKQQGNLFFRLLVVLSLALRVLLMFLVFYKSHLFLAFHFLTYTFKWHCSSAFIIETFQLWKVQKRNLDFYVVFSDFTEVF